MRTQQTLFDRRRVVRLSGIHRPNESKSINFARIVYESSASQKSQHLHMLKI